MAETPTRPSAFRGTDGTLYQYANVTRVHGDDSIVVVYSGPGDNAHLTHGFHDLDIGCEWRRRPHCCTTNKANFFGVMAYDRTWFANNVCAVTFSAHGYPVILALVPPIMGNRQTERRTSPRIRPEALSVDMC
jgi:hypothetical protein